MCTLKVRTGQRQELNRKAACFANSDSDIFMFSLWRQKRTVFFLAPFFLVVFPSSKKHTKTFLSQLQKFFHGTCTCTRQQTIFSVPKTKVAQNLKKKILCRGHRHTNQWTERDITKWYALACSFAHGELWIWIGLQCFFAQSRHNMNSTFVASAALSADTPLRWSPVLPREVFCPQCQIPLPPHCYYHK